MFCTISLQLISSEKAPDVLLDPCPPLPLQPSAPPSASEQQTLVGRVGPAHPGGSWAPLASLLLRDLAPMESALPPLLALLRTHPKLARAPPPHPPHSRPQRLRSLAPLARVGLSSPAG